MAKFGRKDKGDAPAISTAALPDIVFMLLFFFMVTTVMKENEIKVQYIVPPATEVKKLENKSMVSYIYAGVPHVSYQRIYGTEPRIQLNDKIASVDEVREFIEFERNNMPEADRTKLTISIKADTDVKMGLITDIKQELRKSSALKLNYSTKKVAKY